MERRKFIKKTGKYLGATALIGATGIYIIKPKSKSLPYKESFLKLNGALKRHERAIPSLLLDLDAIDHNIEQLKELIPVSSDFRIVVKSLPSPELIQYIMQKAVTNRLMVFHQPFLSEISETSDSEADILLGKPMPVTTAAFYYDNLSGEQEFAPSTQLQWLVDTPLRIKEYIAMARVRSLHVQLNLEIDVGLHRGGFDNMEDLEAALTIISENQDVVNFSGFMGYDPHIVKVPSILLSREEAFSKMRSFYNECKSLVRTKFPQLWHESLTFNGAGSPTVALHKDNDSPLNDISAGSFAVKPTDFDIDTLDSFMPASYIATPILKKYKNTNLPSIENFKGLLEWWDSTMENSFYLYGGSWMADYYEPHGVKGNPIFGKSTNQVMINASDETDLEVGDFVFLRPHQSEFVFLQFENILPFRGDQIQAKWNLL